MRLLKSAQLQSELTHGGKETDWVEAAVEEAVVRGTVAAGRAVGAGVELVVVRDANVVGVGVV